MADRDQILQSILVRGFDQPDDIALVALTENHLSMRRARALFPQGLTRRATLFFGENLYFRHVMSLVPVNQSGLVDEQTSVSGFDKGLHREVSEKNQSS